MKTTDSGKHKTPEDPLVGQLVAGKWRVIGRLHDVGSAVAYRVERVPTGEAARLVLAEESQSIPRGELARFDREARIAGQVKHPRVARILDFGAWRERPFLVAELLKGKRLSDLIGTDEMTVRRAVGIAAQLLEAAGHLHAHGVVHRDLSPAGVVLVDSPAGDQVKIAPPELGLRGVGLAERRGDHGRDLLAIGRMLYAMCVGRAPEGEGAIAEPPRRAAPGRDIGEGLEGVISKAMAPQPGARFQSAADFLSALGTEGMVRPVRPVRPRPAIRVGKGKAARVPGRGGEALSKVKIAWGLAVLVAIVGTGVVLRSAQVGRRAPPVEEEETVVPARPALEARRADVPPRDELPPARAPLPVVPLARVAPAPMVEMAPPPPPAPVRPAPPPKTPSPKIAASAPPTPRALVAPLAPPARVPVSPAGRLASARPGGVNAPAAPAVPLVPITDGERAEVLQLIAARDTAHANEKITALMQRDPRVAWPHVALAELHFRNLWRRDVVRQWQIALALDPTLKEDPRLARHLCLAQDPKWEAAGIGQLRAELGAQATALLATCSPAVPAPTGPSGNPGGAGEQRSGDEDSGGDPER
ncbi:MAG TPA: protein kinase [Polyangia bacterium]